MRRRTVVLGAAASAMLAAAPVRGQQPGRDYRVGVLLPVAVLATGPYLAALREQLAKGGFIEGRNLSIEVRYPVDFSFRAGLEAMRELLTSKPDSIFVCSTVLTLAAQKASESLPIVFAWVSDPVRSGIVADFGKPGTNATGVTNRFLELAVKRVELVRELVPSAKRLAVLAGVFDASLIDAMEVAERAAEHFGITLNRIEAGFDWRGAVERAIAAKADALLITTPFAMFGLRFAADQVVKHTIEHRITTVFSDIESVELGGLVAYAPNLTTDIRRGADVLARVLRGERPADIPVDQASRFDLALNLKTARAIGLTVPPSLLVRADRVIE